MFTRLLLLSGLLAALSFYATSPGTTLAQACPAGSGKIQLESGFLTTAKDFTSAQNIFSFQTSSPCIVDKPAIIPQFSIPSYADMKSIYYDQSKSTSKAEYTGNLGEGGLRDYLMGPSPKNLIHVTGYLSMNGNINGSRTAVVFVDGNLYFSTPMTQFTYGNTNSGIVFVVQGDVNISPSVTRIDAVIITYGQFCSSWNGSGCTVANSPLTVNGSIIALNATKPPIFLRTNNSNDPNNPAELIVYQPKYLIILKDVFAKTLQIWSELTTE